MKYIKLLFICDFD